MAAAAAADADDVETAQIAAFVGTLDEGLETKVCLTLFLRGRGARGGAVVVGEDGDSGDSARGGDPSRHAASPVDPGQFVHPISAF